MKPTAMQKSMEKEKDGVSKTTLATSAHSASLRPKYAASITVAGSTTANNNNNNNNNNHVRAPASASLTSPLQRRLSGELIHVLGDGGGPSAVGRGAHVSVVACDDRRSTPTLIASRREPVLVKKTTSPPSGKPPSLNASALTPSANSPHSQSLASSLKSPILVESNSNPAKSSLKSPILVEPNSVPAASSLKSPVLVDSSRLPSSLQSPILVESNSAPAKSSLRSPVVVESDSTPVKFSLQSPILVESNSTPLKLSPQSPILVESIPAPVRPTTHGARARSDSGGSAVVSPDMAAIIKINGFPESGDTDPYQLTGFYDSLPTLPADDVVAQRQPLSPPPPPPPSTHHSFPPQASPVKRKSAPQPPRPSSSDLQQKVDGPPVANTANRSELLQKAHLQTMANKSELLSDIEQRVASHPQTMVNKSELLTELQQRVNSSLQTKGSKPMPRYSLLPSNHPVKPSSSSSSPSPDTPDAKQPKSSPHRKSKKAPRPPAMTGIAENGNCVEEAKTSENANGVFSEIPPETFHLNVKSTPESAVSVDAESDEEEASFAGRRDLTDARTLEEKKIVSTKGTVRGFRNRVRAGIATFLDHTSKKFNYRSVEKGKIVLYTTSMTVVRETHERCKSARNILHTHMVHFEQRDVYLSHEHQRQLQERLDSADDVPLPQIFIDGVHLGGAETLGKLNESGELRKLLHRFPKTQVRELCEACGGFRYVPCAVCHGSKKSLHRNHFTQEFSALRCMHCNESGLQRCPHCLHQHQHQHQPQHHQSQHRHHHHHHHHHHSAH
ncbi:uncharacterized protein LOC143299237 [Babylonia areolata]|uniref:uncharacterized protein LOC143299237 n=1 Tax=Babylonia areolata TaxID=304850 RepID=UPI003FD134FF